MMGREAYHKTGERKERRAGNESSGRVRTPVKDPGSLNRPGWVTTTMAKFILADCGGLRAISS